MPATRLRDSARLADGRRSTRVGGDANLLSVVITTKDRPGLLGRALRSVLQQRDVPVDVVVVDDGSQPPVSPPVDPRVRLLRNPLARGANAARNAGLAAVRGRWVCFLDDDDEHIAEGVAAAHAWLVAADAPDVAVIGTVTTVDEMTGQRQEHRPYSVRRGSDWLAVPQFAGHHAHNSLVAPTDALRRAGGWNEQIRAATHSELFLRLLLEVDLVALDEPMYLMYESASRPSVRKQYLDRALGTLVTLQVHDRLHGPNPTVTADLRSYAGWQFAQAGDWHRARRSFAQAFTASPTRLRTMARLTYALGGETAVRGARRVIDAAPWVAATRPPTPSER